MVTNQETPEQKCQMRSCTVCEQVRNLSTLQCVGFHQRQNQWEVCTGF
jgi:hypothetical protein